MICSLFIVLWEENQDEISSQVYRNFDEAEAFRQDLIESYKIPSADIKIHELKSSVKLSLLMD